MCLIFMRRVPRPPVREPILIEWRLFDDCQNGGCCDEGTVIVPAMSSAISRAQSPIFEFYGFLIELSDPSERDEVPS